MNYDIQIIVVTLKVTMKFFQRRPWTIIIVALELHVPNMIYKVIVCSALGELNEQ